MITTERQPNGTQAKCPDIERPDNYVRECYEKWEAARLELLIQLIWELARLSKKYTIANAKSSSSDNNAYSK